MSSSRLSLRLRQLPHDVLAELAAQLCCESPALQATAEECMAVHKPLPHDLVERVLLSPDLVPSILGPLEAEDGAAAAVCKQWLAGWQATHKLRGRLNHVRQIIFDSNMYKEGRPCVLVRTCDHAPGSSQCVFGDWVGARVLIWRDQQYALHVTMVRAVSKPEPRNERLTRVAHICPLARSVGRPSSSLRPITNS